jgi:hypothetical protein
VERIIEIAPSLRFEGPSLHGRHDIGEIAQPQPGIDGGVSLRQFGLIPFHIAACGYDPDLRIHLLHLEGSPEGLFRLLPRGLDKSAGIDDDDVGILLLFGETVAGLGQAPQHDLAVHKILGAPEGDKGDCFH